MTNDAIECTNSATTYFNQPSTRRTFARLSSHESDKPVENEMIARRARGCEFKSCEAQEISFFFPFILINGYIKKGSPEHSVCLSNAYKEHLPKLSVCFPMKNHLMHIDRSRTQSMLALFEPLVITSVRQDCNEDFSLTIESRTINLEVFPLQSYILKLKCGLCPGVTFRSIVQDATFTEQH